MGVNNLQEYQQPIQMQDEGLTIVRNPGNVDMTGGGVTGSGLIGTATYDVPGGGGGGSGYTVVSQSGATYNAAQTSGEIVILCDCTANNITINLPTAVGNTAKFHIEKIDSSANSVTIDPNGSETVNGSSTAAIAIENMNLTIVSDGTNWRII